jgi:hypothetical protein
MPGLQNEILPSEKLSVNGLIVLLEDYSNLELPRKYEGLYKYNASFFSSCN